MAGSSAALGTSSTCLMSFQHNTLSSPSKSTSTAPVFACGHCWRTSSSFTGQRGALRCLQTLRNTAIQQWRSSHRDSLSRHHRPPILEHKLSCSCSQAGEDRPSESKHDDGEHFESAGAKSLIEETSTAEVIGVVIVDHGSRRAESNNLLDAFVSLYKAHTGRSLVEPAHMEIAQPSIADAFDKVVERGANVVVVSPYFLSPGRHWFQDIPELAAEASEKHPGIKYLVTAPIGLHPLMADIIEDRIQHCLQRSAGKADECDVCIGTGRCKIVTS
ncbi:hypothetical protein KFL_002200010 [Klebsormidium nitens]|uniref:Sirohydrochlorin ferrochelatase n=1 Tax=Klebsormidium nitens TaxID=105231 RepID=A0A1Y1I2H5_KLENI|nr:hypothetical protein KFL_002200010 [Klebsormidium nitens]|eukprot:GAQ85114.1 hypothetical protein KFL_002200010 [Klebsormidium nitens]